MGSNDIAAAYIEAYEASRAAAQTRRSMLFRVIEGIAWAAMAAAVTLSLVLVAQLVGIDLS